MQWVETTAKTVDEAKSRALDQLGVSDDETEYEILEEPRSGLFGRIKGEARVRARVRPTAVRPKVERRDRKKGRDQHEPASATSSAQDASRASTVPASSGTPAVADSSRTSAKPSAERGDRSNGDRSDHRRDQPNPRQRPAASSTQGDAHPVTAAQVGEEAKKFLDDLLHAFGLDGTVELHEEGVDLELVVAGKDLGLMVGPRGNTLLAIQDLTRVASQRRLGDHDTRLRVDVGGYRERRRDALSKFAEDVAQQVVETGRARALEPMPSADRKIIHDVLTAHTGVVTRSEGDDPERRIVIAPADG